MASCCTCASLLSGGSTLAAAAAPAGAEKQGLSPAPSRTLDCCERVICGACIYRNPRFERYCPYCQISTTPSALPQGLRDPPSYTPTSAPTTTPDDAPPPYIEDTKPTPKPPELPSADPEKAALAASSSASSTPQPLLHFLDHTHDTLSSLSLRYRVPAAALRAANAIPLGADHLLLARRTVLIPTDGSGVQHSLSPRPVDGEGEELRKGRIRRWMVACKEPDYGVAVMYLEAAGYDVELAAERYFEDEEWERRHPLEKGAGKGKERRRRVGVGNGSQPSAAGSTASDGTAGDGWWRRASQAAFLGRPKPPPSP